MRAALSLPRRGLPGLAALALLLGPLSPAWAEPESGPAVVVMDPSASSTISVGDRASTLEIVLIPDPVEYRPVHPDSLLDDAEADETASIPDTAESASHGTDSR